MAKGKEIQKREPGYLVFKEDIGAMKEIMTANLGDASSVSPFDLPRLEVPTGGGLNWQLGTITGTESHKELECIIAAWQNCRAYWPQEFTGGTPPTCAAPDGLLGYGEPGGKCAACPESQWGSEINRKAGKEQGRGQACKQMRRLFLMREGKILPVMLTLPPTSIRRCTRYFVDLVSAQLPFWGVVTKLALEHASSATGITYGVVTFDLVRELTAEEAAKIKEYAEAIEHLLTMPVIPAEYAGEEEAGASAQPVEL